MKNSDQFDDYLSGKLSGEEKTNFEYSLTNDIAFAKQFKDHKKFIDVLKQHQSKIQLKNKLKTIHKELFGDANVVSINKNKSRFDRYVKPFGVAASVAVIAVLCTVGALSVGGYLIKNQNHSITELFKKVERLENTDRAIINNLTVSHKKKSFAPANVEGTGFAINNKGYFITSLHMVRNSDSIFVENSLLERTSARIVHTDNRLDLA
ncbi:MAG TPA: hypothetical protein VNX68_07340, partial [Nitrosopumilaceae archaeon]|nr:hypothetical protein [Nitrosopumilaceae archaeon]